MNPPYWVCYEEVRKGSPWVVRPYSKTNKETRRKGYWSQKEAVRRVTRLRSVWVTWMGIATLKLIPQEKLDEGFTFGDYKTASSELDTQRMVRLAILDIRKAAKRLGMNPDDVVYKIGDNIFPGPLLKSMPADTWEPKVDVTIQVGQRWMSLDPRRKRTFVITRIDEDRIIGDDGRVVAASRLVKRYRPA